MDRSRIGIVIPALNESETIGRIVTAVYTYGLPIVVDDGSSDKTSELAAAAGATVVTHSQNLGYDAALNSGFQKAAELCLDTIITCDADGQHDPSLIKKFIEMIDLGSDIVLGIRSKRQRLSEHIFAWYTNIRFGIKDPLCGMKAYRTDIYNKLGYFDSYESIGTELAIFAAKNRFKINQVRINVMDRKGQSRFGQMLSGNYKIIRAMILSFWCIKKIASTK